MTRLSIELALTSFVALAACHANTSRPRTDAGAARDAAAADSGDAARAADAATSAHDAGVLDAARAPATPAMIGGPGCGLPAAAFCDRFDAPAGHLGRAGELDTRFWSAGRVAPQFTTGNGVAIGIGPGTLDHCRSDVPTQIFPSRDALICDADDDIQDPHLTVVAGAQNYGQSSYRIRQPFDFAKRSGTIVFDAEAFVQNQLIGWISLDVTEDPVDAPSFSLGPGNNDEGSQWPRSGFEVQFQTACLMSDQSTGFALRFIATFDDYVMHSIMPTDPPCIPSARGKLNRFELHVSQDKIEVYASAFSDDGVMFPAMQLVQSVDVHLPFTRGYVQISTHNHASLKYSDNKVDAWVARWNNVGFDGPVITNWREYEIPDKLEHGEGAWNRSGPIVSVGYRVADAADGPRDVLQFQSVDLKDAMRARLSASVYYPYWEDALRQFVLRYRLNGKLWHDRMLTAGELSELTSAATQGQIMQVTDVSLDELVTGTNTLEFVTDKVGQGYPTAVANIDLVLETR